MDQPAPNLAELRRRLDALDDHIHDLVMERAEIVETIAAFKQSTGQPSLQPGREALILRRLMARHRGKLPRQTLVRLWRELLGGTVSIQGKFSVAVADAPGLWDLARDHFGGYVAMTALRSSAEALSAVGGDRVSVGVLPMPANGDAAPWWPALAGIRGHGPRVLARLPFAEFGNGRGGGGDALVIGKAELDPSGADRSLLVVETPAAMSRARLVASFETARRPIVHLAAHQPAPSECWHLLELDGLVLPQGPIVAAALKPLGDQVRETWLLGGYARPLPPETK